MARSTDIATALLLGLAGYGQGRLNLNQQRQQTKAATERDKNEMVLKFLESALRNPNIASSVVDDVKNTLGIDIDYQTTDKEKAEISALEALRKQREELANYNAARKQRVEELLPFEKNEINSRIGANNRRNLPNPPTPSGSGGTNPADLLKFQMQTIDREIKKLQDQIKNNPYADPESLQNRIGQLERLRLRIGSARRPIEPDAFNHFILQEKAPVSEEFKNYLRSKGLPIPGGSSPQLSDSTATTQPQTNPTPADTTGGITDEQIKQYLQSKGYPVTPANIKAVRQQLGG